MKITIGISGTVSRHQKVRIVKVWRGNGYKLNLNRPLGKLTFLSIKFLGKYLLLRMVNFFRLRSRTSARQRSPGWPMLLFSA